MTLYQGRFILSRGKDKDGDVWAEPSGSDVVIKRGKATEPDKGTVVMTLAPDHVQRLAAWAQPQSVVVAFSGLLSREIKELAGSVGLSPENFVVEALNSFIQAGEMAAKHGGQSSAQPADQAPRTPPPARPGPQIIPLQDLRE